VMFASGMALGASRTPRDIMVKDAAPPGQIGKVFGFVSAGLPLGSALTPAPCGWLIDRVGAKLFMLVALAVFGVAGSAALYGHQEGSALENVSLNQLHGWGADVPVLVGYESDGGLYMLWAGARAGGEHVDINDVTSEPKAVTLGTPPIALSATRFWGGGLLGFAVGFRHIHVAFELDVAYATITGDYNDTHVTVSGLSLAPATALWWRF